MAAKKKTRRKTIVFNKHKGKTRANNPSSGLINQKTEPLGKIKQTKYAYDKHLSPALDWAGKAEGNSFEVPSVSLHTNEKIEPKEIIKDFLLEEKNQQLSLFSEELERSRDKAIEFYQHENKWSNRMIAGDSLLVMNSLLTKDNMGGKIQCIYIDPPYGIKYGSNFQPFTNKKDVRDGKDEDLTAEPEMIKAFRDTWELGIHSYLTYMRDRLLLARELLSETGSCFVQISDENVHLIRNIMDEIFGRDNFLAQITFRTKNRPMNSKYLEQMCDFNIWYAKDKNKAKYRDLYLEKNVEGNHLWKYVGFPNGTYRKMTKEEVINHSLLQKYFKNGGKIFRSVSLEPVGKNEKRTYEMEFKGKKYSPSNSWKYDENVMNELSKRKLLITEGNALRGKYFLDYYPVQKLTIPWNDTNLGNNKCYIVQTATKVIQRCILMTTDPGDIVFDPTCGSGTAAYVAEQWGRRWITCDTSRVALTLAKKRLMTATFDYYKLENSDESVSSGFQYKKVPHTTLGSIANNEPELEETLYDQPIIDNSKIRVTSPFTMESIPSHSVESMKQENNNHYRYSWLDEVKRTGVRGKKGITTSMKFARLETMYGTEFLHAEGVTTNPRKVIFSFGTEHAPLDKRQVEVALKEVRSLDRDRMPDILIFAAFSFDPEASRMISESSTKNMKIVEVQMNIDLQTYDLKKKLSSNDSFWLVGEPDVKLKKEKGNHFTVEVKGWDYYDPASNSVESGGSDRIAMWILDTNYNERAVHPKQVFFPMSKKNDGWEKLAKVLKAEVDQKKTENFRGTKSLPFEVGGNRKVAVKIVDDRGIESLKVIDLKAA